MTTKIQETNKSMSKKLQLAVENVKRSSLLLGASSIETRNRVLTNISALLHIKREEIFLANRADMGLAELDKLGLPLLNRLKFDEGKLKDSISGIQQLISLDDPLNKSLLKRELDKNLILNKVSCPIGLIGVIFESRPDALVQISSLCIKSGNGVILKGGREAAKTNKVLFDIIKEAGLKAGLPNDFALLLESREDINEILSQDQHIDLIIPRGSNEFVKYIKDNSRIPVMGHADGVCHVYVDKEADLQMALNIVKDSKTQYVSACNALESLLVHKDIAEAFLPLLHEASQGTFTIRGCPEAMDIIEAQPLSPDDYKKEYLDYILALKIVASADEAIDHINTYGSHHTDSIVTNNEKTAETFFALVDSAGVYQNCSTRFADGYRYGFGAEVGISTGKLHARGPVGLDGLVTYKYILKGTGNIVSDYASGEKSFHFKDL